MANNPKKITDPTEAALSAIQDALEVREEKTASDENPAPASAEPEIVPDVRRPSRSSLTSERPRNGDGLTAEKPRNGASTEADEELFAEPAARSLRGEEPASRRPAANDDRQSIGQILQA